MSDFIAAENLHVQVADKRLLSEVSLKINAGEVVALVGPSGAGKTITARALMGLLALRPGVVSGDLVLQIDETTRRPYSRVLQNGISIEQAFAGIRGEIVGYMPQAARQALDPVRKVRWQVQQAASMNSENRDTAPHTWLKRAGFQHPSEVMVLYPHELSGGMAQRVLIAQALARGSQFLIVDEPARGLDAPVKQSIFEELGNLASRGVGILLITHDFLALKRLASRVFIMDQGTVVETTTVDALLNGQVETEVALAMYDGNRRIITGGTR